MDSEDHKEQEHQEGEEHDYQTDPTFEFCAPKFHDFTLGLEMDDSRVEDYFSILFFLFLIIYLFITVLFIIYLFIYCCSFN